MTSLPPTSSQPPEPTPSWAVPIAVGAAAAFVAQVFPVALQMLPGVLGGLGCCCCAAGPLVGAVPGWVAARRDPRLTTGQAFAVAFIAVGLGSVIVAAVFVAGASQLDQAEMERSMREMLRTLNEGAPAGNRMTPEEIDESIAMMKTLAPYGPIVTAALTTVFGGLFGMLGAALGRRR